MPERKFIADFVADSTEQLAKVERLLLRFETAGAESDSGLIDTVFRCVHTTKGGAGILGLTQIQTLAHETEHVLQLLRNRIFDLDATSVYGLLRVIDALLVLVCDAPQSNQRNIDFPLLELKKLQMRAPGAIGQTEPLWGIPQHQVGSAIATAMENYVGETLEPVRDSHGVERRVMNSEVGLRMSMKSYDRLTYLAEQLLFNRDEICKAVGPCPMDESTVRDAAERFDALATELYEVLMNSRRQPISSVFNRFQRTVREISAKLNKECRLSTEANDVEVDQRILSVVCDALTHLLRNSLDHGIEVPAVRSQQGKPSYGTITLRALPQDGSICISISDDGAGIDPQKVRHKAELLGLISPPQAETLTDTESIELIFRPGVSTAERVSVYSGRGVGMDAVRTNIELIGGSVDVQSEIGKGTVVVLYVPSRITDAPA